MFLTDFNCRPTCPMILEFSSWVASECTIFYIRPFTNNVYRPLIYINDLPKSISTECPKTYRPMVHNSVCTVKIKFEWTIEFMEKWCSSNKLKINSDKTTGIMFNISRHVMALQLIRHADFWANMLNPRWAGWLMSIMCPIH